MNAKRAATSLAWALRVGLGAVFVVSGALKLRDPGAFAIEVVNYQLFPALGPLLAVCLPPLELVLGLALALSPRVWARAAALVSVTLLAVFTLAVGSVVARGINISCGCFGGDTGPVTWLTVARDVGLLACAALLLVLLSRPTAPTRRRLDPLAP